MCNGSGDQAELWRAEGIGGCEGDGALAESGGLGLPNIADRIEYSKFAASEPNAKLGSKLRLNRGSAVAGNGSAGAVSMTKNGEIKGRIYVVVKVQGWALAFP